MAKDRAVSGGLVPSIHHVFERRGPIGKDLTFLNRNALE